MKKTFFVICFALIVIPVFSQFQVSHGTPDNEVGKSVRTLMFDEAFIIGGLTDHPFISRVDATLLKTRYDGTLMWSKVYGLEDFESFNSVRPIFPKDDKGYVCLGTTNSVGYGSNDLLYVWTDPDGNPITTHVYGGENRDIGHCIQVVKDEETDEPVVIMIGETYSYTNTSKMYIIKTKLDGTFIDGVIVGYKGNQYGYWIEQTKDGGYIAVGSSDFACGIESDSSNLDIFVVKLKPSLDLEWARTIGGGPDLPYRDVAYSVKEIEKGYMITGQTRSFGIRNTNDAFLLKMDHGGGLIWLRNYGYVQNDGAYDVLEEEFSSINHQYILNGYTTIEDNVYALLVATNFDGNVMWEKAYGWKGVQSGYEMDKTLNPGYVFTGVEYSFGLGLRGIYQTVTDDIGNSNCPDCEIIPPIKSRKHDPCILEEGFSKHIETGMQIKIKQREVEYKTIHCGTKEKSAEGLSVAQNNQTELMVYPNPSTGIINVSYPEEFKSGELKIFNNLGQQIFSRSLSETNSTLITLDDIGSGLYSIVLLNSKGELISSNLLIE